MDWLDRRRESGLVLIGHYGVRLVSSRFTDPGSFDSSSVLRWTWSCPCCECSDSDQIRWMSDRGRWVEVTVVRTDPPERSVPSGDELRAPRPHPEHSEHCHSLPNPDLSHTHIDTTVTMAGQQHQIQDAIYSLKRRLLRGEDCTVYSLSPLHPLTCCPATDDDESDNPLDNNYRQNLKRKSRYTRYGRPEDPAAPPPYKKVCILSTGFCSGANRLCDAAHRARRIPKIYPAAQSSEIRSRRRHRGAGRRI